MDYGSRFVNHARLKKWEKSEPRIQRITRIREEERRGKNPKILKTENSVCPQTVITGKGPAGRLEFLEIETRIVRPLNAWKQRSDRRGPSRDPSATTSGLRFGPASGGQVGPSGSRQHGEVPP